MTNGVRTAGGIIAIIIGGYTCYLHGTTMVLNFMVLDPNTIGSFWQWNWILWSILQTICAVWALVGGIDLIKDRTFGGILAILGGSGLLLLHPLFYFIFDPVNAMLTILNYPSRVPHLCTCSRWWDFGTCRGSEA